MAGKKYLEADRDPRFLQHDDMRGIRLELEYLKAERLLQSHGVRHAILMLGSTRIGARSGTELARYTRWRASSAASSPAPASAAAARS